MFSLIETFTPSPRRGWTALVGFTLQFAVLSALLVLPLLCPHTLPDAIARSRIFVPVASEARVRVMHDGAQTGGDLRLDRLVVASRPFTFNRTPGESTSEPPVLPPGDASFLGQADSDRAVASLLDGVARPVPSPPASRSTRTSVVMEGNLLERIAPQYPPVAKRMGIQGTVLIKAEIGRLGRIEKAQVMSGNPWLSAAALNAVRQWKYRPYYLNGEPVEVETEITVNFVLNH